MDKLRDVLLDGYRLQTWDTGRVDHYGKSKLAYQFNAPDGEEIFVGADFACSPMCAIDSDDSLRSLLGFLTLKPGDTDSEYFQDYTPRQRAFAEQEAEALQLWSMEDLGDETPQFRETDES